MPSASITPPLAPPTDLSGQNVPLLGPPGSLNTAIGWVEDYTDPTGGGEATDWNLVYTSNGTVGGAWTGRGVASPDGAHDIFLELFNGQQAETVENVYAGFHSDDANAWIGMANIAGVPHLGFFMRAGAGTLIAQPNAITAPSGGTTVDTQARTAITAILNLLSAAAGGYGLTK